MTSPVGPDDAGRSRRGVKAALGRSARAALRPFGYELLRAAAGDGTGGADEPVPPDFTEADIELFRSVQPYTLTSIERVVALREAVRALVAAGTEGAMVECGVWRGGSMLVVARTLCELGATDRDLYLFDTFTTMPPPGDVDVDVFGHRMADYYQDALAHPHYSYLPFDEVRALLVGTGYPEPRLHFVQGMVEETIPGAAPSTIALCRLDTDLYASTAHEMRHLVPRLSEGGVLIIDDYGHLLGARLAVDEYLAEHRVPLLLNRIDWTGRLAVMTAAACQAVRRQ